MILVIADTHGEMDSYKLNNSFVKKACGGVFPEYVIVAGDFGFIFSNNSNNPTEKYWLNWLNSKPWTTLFIDGNHENFERLNTFPTENKFNSKVGKVSDKVFHLKRGEVYTIEEKIFFTFGGAQSVDKEHRKEHISWWKEEEPSYTEFLHGMESLEKVNYQVDYVITHACPKSIFSEIEYLLPFWCEEKAKDSTLDLLEAFKEKIVFKKWLFGHYHIDKSVNEKLRALYETGFIII